MFRGPPIVFGAGIQRADTLALLEAALVISKESFYDAIQARISAQIGGNGPAMKSKRPVNKNRIPLMMNEILREPKLSLGLITMGISQSCT